MFLQLLILDANDNEPSFDTEPESLAEDRSPCHREGTIAVNAPTGAFVLSLTASDSDAEDSLTFRLLPSEDTEFFRINSTSGDIHWLPPLSSSAEARIANVLLAHEAGSVAPLSFKVLSLQIIYYKMAWVLYTIPG